MRKIRILIVDDAVVVRRLLSDVLASDPEFQIAGTAANGRIGLARIPQVNPDVVILDVEMPEMDGLETLAEIRKTYPLLPVIMYSTLTQRGAAATLDALALGANDYVTKPSNVGGATQAIAAIKESLSPKIRTFGARAAGLDAMPVKLPTLPVSRAQVRPPLLPRRGRIDVVTIGTSTGGPNALSELVPGLPGDLPVPVVIVQHMPPVFTKLLADRLSSKSKLRVQEGQPGCVLQAGDVWIAPGNFHMTVERDGALVKIGTNQGPPENSCRPAVDVLFRSVAKVYGSGSLGVVMTGMGQDGLRGSEYIRDAGGLILAQDEATSVVWGMPGYVAQAGLAERVLPLDQLGGEIARRVMASRGLTAA